MLFDTDLITYRGLFKTIQTDKLNIPTKDGRRTILSNHMPILIPIDLGVIETNNNGKLSHFVVSEGMLYFENNKATIVCDLIEDIENVDVSFYEKRLAEANEKLSSSRNDNDIKKASIQLARAANVLKYAKRTH